MKIVPSDQIFTIEEIMQKFEKLSDQDKISILLKAIKILKEDLVRKGDDDIAKAMGYRNVGFNVYGDSLYMKQ